MISKRAPGPSGPINQRNARATSGSGQKSATFRCPCRIAARRVTPSGPRWRRSRHHQRPMVCLLRWLRCTGRSILEELHSIYRRYRTIYAVSISGAQRTPLRFFNWIATVHHGLPRDLLRFSPGPGKYLAFLGRISPGKRPDIGIEVARKVGIPFKRGQDRCRRPCLLRADHQAAARSASRRVHRLDQRVRKERVPRRCDR